MKDQILFTILDWEQGVLRLERERFGVRDQALLVQRNRLLADLFYDLLESAASESLYVPVAVPTAYARLPDKSGYPPDHWITVVNGDERMTTDAWMIRYSNGSPSMFDRLARELAGEPRYPPPKPVSRQQGEEVYRFRAAPAHRQNRWREVEVKGEHSLADLDLALRLAFDRDTSDHMSGFWKLVPRGVQTKPGAPMRGATRQARYREVELADVNPMGSGEGAKAKIAGLGLRVGEQLKYVYDFGDWIEYRLSLEAIEKPQAGVRYPREVTHDQPE